MDLHVCHKGKGVELHLKRGKVDKPLRKLSYRRKVESVLLSSKSLSKTGVGERWLSSR